jgi:hypothetical protein
MLVVAEVEQEQLEARVFPMVLLVVLGLPMLLLEGYWP